MFRPLALTLLLMPATGQAQSLWEAGGARVETVLYACEHAMDELSVAFLTAPDATSFAAVQIGGQVRAFVQDVSGSGVRYVDIDAQSGYRLLAKGDMLLLMKQEAEDAAEEQLLAECSADRAG